MEKILQPPVEQTQTTPISSNELSQNLNLESTSRQISSINILKPATVTPDRLVLPKAFKYPDLERYTSPTDLMMSPISRGLLARTKKPSHFQKSTKRMVST